MKLRTIIFLLASHIIVGFAGFAAGIYTLPILTAPPAPTLSEIEQMSQQALFTANFRKDLEGSDALHWGEGKVAISTQTITLDGKLAPGPDYKLYLSPTFVETEAEFLQHKDTMIRVGSVKTFENFVVDLSQDINPSEYNSVIIWCEAFGEFITAAKYQ